MYFAQAEVSKRQYSSKAKSSNVRDFLAAKNTVRQVNFRTFEPLSHFRTFELYWGLDTLL
jgi:hypothetical protein